MAWGKADEIYIFLSEKCIYVETCQEYLIYIYCQGFTDCSNSVSSFLGVVLFFNLIHGLPSFCRVIVND